MESLNQKIVQEEKRIIFFGAVRLTQTEYEFVKKDFQKSPHTSRSAYMRAKIFAEKISNAHQKKHKAFLEAAKLNSEINRIGTNFNQLIYAINTI